jgi:pimeloyl-ACP methyl ester carboxylesterase
LFLNGSGSTLDRVGWLLDRLRRRCELLAHDQRGLGRTSTPDVVPTMSDYALDALALTDHVGWDRFRVLGISFGGMVAQELAVTVPDRVERLALLCTSPGGAGGSSYPLHELGPGDAEPTMIDTRFTTEWLTAHPESAVIAEGFRAHRAARQPRGASMQLEARRDHDVWNRLPAITCPTLVAAGRYDGIAPLVNSEAIASRIPGADLRVYEGGHTFFVQDRQALTDTLAFLSR